MGINETTKLCNVTQTKTMKQNQKHDKFCWVCSFSPNRVGGSFPFQTFTTLGCESTFVPWRLFIDQFSQWVLYFVVLSGTKTTHAFTLLVQMERKRNKSTCCTSCNRNCYNLVFRSRGDFAHVNVVAFVSVKSYMSLFKCCHRLIRFQLWNLFYVNSQLFSMMIVPNVQPSTHAFLNAPFSNLASVACQPTSICVSWHPKNVSQAFNIIYQEQV